MAETGTGVKYAEKAASKGAAQMKEASDRLGATAEESARAIEDSTKTAAGGMTDLQFKALEIARSNAMAAFDYAQDAMAARSPSDLLKVWTSHSRKQFDRLTGQTKELSDLAQRVAGDTMQPISQGIRNLGG